MNFCLCGFATVILVVLSVQSTSAKHSTILQIMQNMRKGFDTLHSLIKELNKGKCHGQVGNDTRGGAVYIRWGNTECPGLETSLVYTGFAGGSHFSHRGGAAEYICLPTNPIKSTDKYNYGHVGYVYGAEYQISGEYPKDHDVPCAVCQSNFRPNSFMLPGSNVCPEPWYREYQGHLMSNFYNHVSASQYVCVDDARKSLFGGQVNADGKLFFPVRAVCGSLRCPPYENKQLLTCAVCTR